MHTIFPYFPEVFDLKKHNVAIGCALSNYSFFMLATSRARANKN